ncbi:MAG: hypothetical protein KDB22_30055, partial [Planctomycetales bacterium]|nr:hypothetical protein [Planctomycetales bacterium]
MNIAIRQVISKTSLNILGLAIVANTCGCASFTTKLVGRATDGKFSGYCLKTRTKGIPCKFKVPTHVEVTIEETFFLQDDTGHVLEPEQRILNATSQFVYSDQVFMVEVPRPIAGTLDLTAKDKKGYTFNKEGHLIQIGAAIEDKTIQDVTS